ncbi:siderophore-interacting protein [Motilibacter aurantiacus]|uniref:siderophore-interacting protein n=1 Tax=Motilibacter aurantiacus TaxID=2714955 RepID=UPI0014078FDC|nr:siderophore-interacting protein [Motilibacter aurantiacus]NHC43881.1 siderophore-interacting protein [Motilibacter aurantiacus]
MTAAPVAAPVAPWGLFLTAARRVQRLSPSFVRVTLAGHDLHHVADQGWDTRCKLLLPVPGAGLDVLPGGPDWYAGWRALPDEARLPMRTYTVRAVRPELGEVDVDLVLHEPNGPAGRWAAAAVPGSPVGFVAPDARHPGPYGGYEFHLPADDPDVLLAADETAVPAVAAILERLPRTAHGTALLEVPYAADVLAIDAPPGVRLRWLGREGAAHGSLLLPAVREALALRSAGCGPEAVPVPDPDAGPDAGAEALVWDAPQDVDRGSGPYAWVAGEAGMVRDLRRCLLAEHALDRRRVALMGYWRRGRASG